MAMMFGKPKRYTIALIFTIQEETEYIWSGSLVQYDKHAFIVSNVTRYADTSIIKIVAFAIGTHNKLITTE
jgi:hypothetical protein